MTLHHLKQTFDRQNEMYTFLAEFTVKYTGEQSNTDS